MRKIELTYVEFQHIKFNTDCILVEVQRRKQAGPKKQVSFAVTDEWSRGFLSLYVNQFSSGANTEGRLFRKFNVKTNKPTQQVIDENIMATFAADVARTKKDHWRKHGIGSCSRN